MLVNVIIIFCDTVDSLLLGPQVSVYLGARIIHTGYIMTAQLECFTEKCISFISVNENLNAWISIIITFQSVSEHTSPLIVPRSKGLYCTMFIFGCKPDNKYNNYTFAFAN